MTETLEKQKLVLGSAIDMELLERLKTVVFWSPGWTLSDFISACLNKALTEIEANRVEEFPKRGKMRKGSQGYAMRTKLLDLSEWVP